MSLVSVDIPGLDRLERTLAALDADVSLAEFRARTRTGERARTLVRRALSRETGAPQKVIKARINFFKGRPIHQGEKATRVWVGLKHPITSREWPGAEKAVRKAGGAVFPVRFSSGHQANVTRSPRAASSSGRDRRGRVRRGRLPVELPTVRLDKPARVELPLAVRQAYDERYRTEFRRDLARRVNRRRRRR